MKELIVSGGCFVLLFLYLLIERILIAQKIQEIPLRICVTGTRGKSSVTRLVAASLREAGFSVLSKTTGSMPAVILPDGSEKEIIRRGNPTILEGKRILKMGSKIGVQACVLEMMSIHPESIFMESTRLFKPQVLIITNVRPDHLAQMGGTKEEIACCFASAIPEKCTVFIPEEEFFPVFQKTAEERNAKLIQIPRDTSDRLFKPEKKLAFFEFDENICLSLAVAEYLEIDRAVALQGMTKAQPDFGSLRAWTIELDSPSRTWYFISSFAANDPESTRHVLSKLKRNRLLDGRIWIGLLNLRGDRGDRTLQWLDILKKGYFPEFHRLVIIGEHAWVLKRKLKSLSNKTSLFTFKSQPPKRIMKHLFAIEKREAVLVGMGNMGGLGKALVTHWNEVGVPCDI